MLVGIALMLVGPWLVSALHIGAPWTDADFQEHQQASADLHAATTLLPQGPDRRSNSKRDAYDPVAAKQKYTAAKAAYDKQEARLQAARSRPVWTAWLLRLTGIALIAWGLYGYAITQRFPATPYKSIAPPPTKPSQSPPQRATLPPGYNEFVTKDGPPPRSEE